MVSTKKTPAKAGVSAVDAHHRQVPSPALTPAGTSSSGGKKKRTAASVAENWNFTHTPPTAAERAKNGRHEGRNLITWTRPRMAEKLLLHMQYECSRFKVELPWDNIAHRLHPGSSGGALMQHLNRMRHQLVAEGHLVPPICQKPGSRVQVDPIIRGYVRQYPNSDDTVTTRPVKFDEPMDDRKFNLPDAYDRPDIPASVKRENMGGVARKAAPMIKKEPSPDPADLESDAEYTPGSKAVPKNVRRSARATKATVNYAVDEDNEYSNEFYGDESTDVVEKQVDDDGDIEADVGADEVYEEEENVHQSASPDADTPAVETARPIEVVDIVDEDDEVGEVNDEDEDEDDDYDDEVHPELERPVALAPVDDYEPVPAHAVTEHTNGYGTSDIHHDDPFVHEPDVDYEPNTVFGQHVPQNYDAAYNQPIANGHQSIHISYGTYDGMAEEDYTDEDFVDMYGPAHDGYQWGGFMPGEEGHLT